MMALEKLLQEILAKLNNIEADVKQMKPKIDENYREIKGLTPKIEESHRWLSALSENKEMQKAELDSLKHELTRVSGVLKGFDNSLELLKKAE